MPFVEEKDFYGRDDGTEVTITNVPKTWTDTEIINWFEKRGFGDIVWTIPDNLDKYVFCKKHGVIPVYYRKFPDL